MIPNREPRFRILLTVQPEKEMGLHVKRQVQIQLTRHQVGSIKLKERGLKVRQSGTLPSVYFRMCISYTYPRRWEGRTRSIKVSYAQAGVV